MRDGIDHNQAYQEKDNIKRMQQWRLPLNSSIPMDDLNYTNPFNGIIQTNNGSMQLKKNVETTKLGDCKTSVNHPLKTVKANIGMGNNTWQ